MMLFMLAVLGSVVFWIVYLSVSFVVASVIIKFKSPKSFRYLTTGKPPEGISMDDYDEMVPIVLFILSFLFWPIVVTGYIISLLFRIIIGPLLMTAIKTGANIIPEFEIKKKEN